MNTYNPEKHHRQSLRLKGYDYSQAGLYFITLCCHNRLHLFGHIADGVMIVNELGKIVIEAWLETPVIRPNVELHAYIVMPNHFHAIIEICYSANPAAALAIGEFKSPSQTLGAIIRGFKGTTTRRIKEKLAEMGGDVIRRGEWRFAPTEWAVRKSDDMCGNGDMTGVGGDVIRGGEWRFAPTECARMEFAPALAGFDGKIWQRDYYDHIIREYQVYENITNYILNNPLTWDKDTLKT